MIISIDIGGSSVKTALWNNEKLENKKSFSSPDNWADMEKELFKTIYEYKKIIRFVKCMYILH